MFHIDVAKVDLDVKILHMLHRNVAIVYPDVTFSLRYFKWILNVP